jgi:hypothetical protein
MRALPDKRPPRLTSVPRWPPCRPHNRRQVASLLRHVDVDLPVAARSRAVTSTSRSTDPFEPQVSPTTCRPTWTVAPRGRGQGGARDRGIERRCNDEARSQTRPKELTDDAAALLEFCRNSSATIFHRPAPARWGRTGHRRGRRCAFALHGIETCGSSTAQRTTLVSNTNARP